MLRVRGTTPSAVRTALRQDKENCPDIIPTLQQITSRKHYLSRGGNIEDTFAHFAQLEIDNPVPSDPLGEGKHTPFVMHLNPQPQTFMLIISTPALLYNAVHQARATGTPLITTDGTYKTTTAEFPLNLLGTMNECHQWRLIMLCLSAHEGTVPFTKMYDVLRQWLHELHGFAYEEYGEVYTLQDGDRSYPAAQRASFATSIDPSLPPATVKNLTCFTHVMRALSKNDSKYLQHVDDVAKLGELMVRVQAMADLTTPEQVTAAFQLLGEEMTAEKGLLGLFTAFMANWGPDSGRGAWQLGASPRGFPRSNNGHESWNRIFKDEVTNYKLTTLSRLVKEVMPWLFGVSRDPDMAPTTPSDGHHGVITVRPINGSSPYKEAFNLVNILRLPNFIMQLDGGDGSQFAVPSQGLLQDVLKDAVTTFRQGNFVVGELSPQQLAAVDAIAAAEVEALLVEWQGPSGDGYAPRPTDTVDELLSRAKSFYILQYIPPAARKCAQVAYQCTCRHHHMYQFCKHAIALGIINKVISVPDTENPTAITRVRRQPGRRPKVPPALQLLPARRASKRTWTASSVVEAALASAVTLQPSNTLPNPAVFLLQDDMQVDTPTAADNVGTIMPRAVLPTPTAIDPRMGQALRTLSCTAAHSGPGGIQLSTSNAANMQIGTLHAEAPLLAHGTLPSPGLCVHGVLQVDLNAAGSLQPTEVFTEPAPSVLHGRMQLTSHTAPSASMHADASHVAMAAGVLPVSRADLIPDLNF